MEQTLKGILDDIFESSIPPKPTKQIEDEAQARDILYCLDSMQEWEDFSIKLYAMRTRQQYQADRSDRDAGEREL